MSKHTIGSLTLLVKTLRTERNNLRTMYEHAKKASGVEKLKKTIKELRALVKVQAEVIALQQEQITALKLRVEELERIIWGKHKRNKGDPESLPIPAIMAGSDIPKHPLLRSTASYRRAIPSTETITSTHTHALCTCPDCGNTLTHKKTLERFVEDIPSLEVIQKLLHTVTQHSIETGYCTTCKKQKSAIPLSKHTVSFGGNIRAFICYATIIQRQSYAQIKQFLGDMAGIALSEGEIANILESEKMKLVPEYEAMKERLRQEYVIHMDETTWPVAQEDRGNFSWLMTGPHKESEMVFLCGRSRGKGNAEELLGKIEKNEPIGVSDDYPVYKNLFKQHQLCWAHPLRKLRDLAESPSLTETQRKYCSKTSVLFKKLYSQLRGLLEAENTAYSTTKIWKKESLEHTKNTLQKQFIRLTKIHSQDPKKLRTYKTSLMKNLESYFTCLSGPGIPTDNNKAERGIRPLVLKRRMSQGSKTQKGADIFSVLASVLYSLKAKYPSSFFQEYHRLMEGV